MTSSSRTLACKIQTLLAIRNGTPRSRRFSLFYLCQFMGLASIYFLYSYQNFFFFSLLFHIHKFPAGRWMPSFSMADQRWCMYHIATQQLVVSVCEIKRIGRSAVISSLSLHFPFHFLFPRTLFCIHVPYCNQQTLSNGCNLLDHHSFQRVYG